MDDAMLRQAVHRTRLQIAIDGPAGAGKSTIGKGVAARVRCPYLDTGLMYRAVAWLALRDGVAPSDAPTLARIARDTEFESPASGTALLVNGVPREAELRTASVDAVVSEVSAHLDVRRALVSKQQAFAEGRCVVMVGRDIGTTVLPHAQVKLWITASPEERARRRLREGLAGSDGVSMQLMADRIKQRDAVDSARETSPLRRATDAVMLSTDDLGAHEVIQAALTAINDALGRLLAVDSA